jgi:hypothetical protein
MKQFEVRTMRLLMGACLFVIAPGLVTVGHAQQPVGSAASTRQVTPAVRPALQATAEEQQQDATKPAKPGNEGIKVHGRWVIDVKNPDGTLAQHRVFENSLQNSGGSVLVGLVGGYWVPGDFGILLFPGTGPGICAATYGCAIVQSSTTFLGSYVCSSAQYTCVVGLSKTVNVIIPDSLVLSGQLTAPQTGTIGGVATELGVCGDVNALSEDSTNTPSSCTTLSPTGPGAVGAFSFTSTFPAPISVSAGQIVQVSVTITFS